MPLPMVAFCKPVQSWNTAFPREVTVSGMIMFTRPEHCANASAPILSTAEPNVTDSNPTSPANILSGISVMPLPSSTFWSAEQFRNTSGVIAVTPSPIFI